MVNARWRGSGILCPCPGVFTPGPQAGNLLTRTLGLRGGGEYLFQLVDAARCAQERQEYLDSIQVQVMTGRNAERENTRGASCRRIQRRYCKTWKEIHRCGDNLAKRLSTRSLISLHQSIGYEGGGNLLSTKPTST